VRYGTVRRCIQTGCVASHWGASRRRWRTSGGAGPSRQAGHWRVTERMTRLTCLAFSEGRSDWLVVIQCILYKMDDHSRFSKLANKILQFLT